jgi:hypothetical protein
MKQALYIPPSMTGKKADRPAVSGLRKTISGDKDRFVPSLNSLLETQLNGKPGSLATSIKTKTYVLCQIPKFAANFGEYSLFFI